MSEHDECPELDKWDFKQTWLGTKFFVAVRIPSHSPGEFHKIWRQATKKDIKSFRSEIEEMKKSHEELEQLKKSHPEYFI